MVWAYGRTDFTQSTFMKGNSLVMWVYLVHANGALEILFSPIFHGPVLSGLWLTLIPTRENLGSLFPILPAQNWVGKFPQEGTYCHLILSFLETQSASSPRTLRLWVLAFPTHPQVPGTVRHQKCFLSRAVSCKGNSSRTWRLTHPQSLVSVHRPRAD